MTRRKWLWAAVLAVPAVVGGLAYANAQKTGAGYVCPVTGEELPCEKCCPLNGAPAAEAAKAGEPKPPADEGYVCPITGEKLGCPNCCPLNKAK